MEKEGLSIELETKKEPFLTETEFKSLDNEGKKKSLSETREFAVEMYRDVFSSGKKVEEIEEGLDQTIKKFTSVSKERFPSEQKVAFAESLEWATGRARDYTKGYIDQYPQAKDLENIQSIDRKLFSFQESLSKKRKEILIESMGENTFKAWEIIKAEDSELFSSVDIRLDDSAENMRYVPEKKVIYLPGENAGFFKKFVIQEEENINITAERLGWSKEKVIKNIQVLAFLHELGHAKDFFEKPLSERGGDVLGLYLENFRTYIPELKEKYTKINSPLFNKLREGEVKDLKEIFNNGLTDLEQEFFEELQRIYKKSEIEIEADNFVFDFVKKHGSSLNFRN